MDASSLEERRNKAGRIENLDSDTSAKRVPPRISIRLHPASHEFGARKNKPVLWLFSTCSLRVEKDESPIIVFCADVTLPQLTQEHLGFHCVLHHGTYIVNTAASRSYPVLSSTQVSHTTSNIPLQCPGRCSCTKCTSGIPRAGSIATAPRIRRMGNSQRAYRSASAGVCASQRD